MWKMLQQKNPQDFVIATGKQHTVKEFVNLVLKELEIKLNGRVEVLMKNVLMTNNQCIVACDKEYFRPLEVDTLLGNSQKAKKN